MATYTVVQGDCLWNIALSQLGSGLLWTYLADLNGISRTNPVIYPDQVLQLDDGGDPPSAPVTTTTTSKVTIQYFGLQAGTDKTVFLTWSWDRSNTDHYQVIWYYDTGNGVWFKGSDTTTEDKESVYTAPSNAQKVKVKVLPVSTTHKVNNKDTNYWTGSWSTFKTYDFSDNPPTVPPVPTVEINNYTMVSDVSNLDINADHVQFQVVLNDITVYKTGLVPIVTTAASFSCAVEAGGEYKVRCRGYRKAGDVYGDWSEYSANNKTIPSTIPTAPTCKALGETSAHLSWDVSPTAVTYELEYTTEKNYFDSSDGTTVISGIEVNNYQKTGLEIGDEYFFRVRAVNEVGSSSWSPISSLKLGDAPAAPTTWSSTTTVITGDALNLYWVHNSKDGSSEVSAEMEITIGGTTNTYTIQNDQDPEVIDDVNVYSIDTSGYVEGTAINWRVRTRGITEVYGDWSIQRTVDVYAPPTLVLAILDSLSQPVSTLEAFPFFISAIPGPVTQDPIGYHITIIANDSYETLDDVGRKKKVSAGDAVYSKFFDIQEDLMVLMSPSNLDLENNVDYTITCVVAMDSGLNGTDSANITVSWTDEQYEPMAEIGYDEDAYSTYINPYCLDENEALVSDVTLSVYRREYDGTFVEIAKDLPNNKNTFVIDPHPALDYARYRIVAITTTTGAISYYDPPGYPVEEKSVLIQWAEAWSNFEASPETETLEQQPWVGSLLKLPYNIDVSDNYNMDVSHVRYAGRSHPISYYGTQVGETAVWNVAIVKDDEETLYALRRLARWMGDVYVREPSGSGYWANIKVSFNQTHKELIIPVSFEITRVEGGV